MERGTLCRVLGELVAVAVTVAAVGGCSGDGGSKPATATTATTAGGTPPTTAPAPTIVTTTWTPTSTSSSTSTTSTTLPPQLVVTQVAELAGRAVDVQFWDGATFVGLSEVAAPLGSGSSIVRLDAAGAITQEAAAPGAWSLLDAARAGDRWYVLSYDGTTCGVQPLDLPSLTLGPIIAEPTDRGCAGQLTVDSGDGAVLLAPEVSTPAFFRLDTRAGGATRVSLEPAVPAAYAVDDLLSVGGTTFVMLGAGLDPRSNQAATAPDGSPLPLLLARVDPVTGSVTTVVVAGRVHTAGERLVVRLGDGRAQVIDPVTLAVSEVPDADVPIEDDFIAVTGEAAWTFEVDDAGMLTIVQRDPATTAELGSASVDSGLGGRVAGWRGFTVAADAYIVATVRERVDQQPVYSTRLYRAWLQPAG